MGKEKKDKNYVEATFNEYYDMKKNETKYTKDIYVKGNNDRKVARAGKTLVRSNALDDF